MALCTIRMHISAVLLLILLISTATATRTWQSQRHLLQSQKFEECKSSFDALGGSEEEIALKLPACTAAQPVLSDCCSQVKDLLSQAPSDCLCDWDVWNAVQARAGENAGTLKQFLDVCSIPNAGSGNC